jgi:hypothetical protein
MLGGGRQLFDDTIREVEAWSPTKDYDHERKFQSELQDWLDEQLNSGGGGMMGGGGQPVPVETEHGKSKADIAVDDTVGIEMKRDLSNSQTKKLRGQIDDYMGNYNYVIVCACGIKDTSGWRKLKKRFQQPVYIWKKKEELRPGTKQPEPGRRVRNRLGL